MSKDFETKIITEKLDLKTTVMYGIGGMGEDIAYNIFYMFFIFFLTSVAGINPAAAGTISLIAVMWDAITDPIVGYLSDRYKGNKFGKRAPFILAGAIPLGLFVFILFCDVNLGQTAKILYFIMINIAFWMFFTIVDIPYIAVASEVTDDYDSKTRLRTSVLLFSAFGQVILTVGILKFMDFMALQGKSDVLTWKIIGAVLGTVTAIAFLTTAVALRGKERNAIKEETVENNQSGGFIQVAFKDAKDLFHIKQYRLTACMGFLYNVFLGVSNSSLLYFLMFTCRFDNNQIAMVNFWPGIISIMFIVPMGNLIVKLGKKSGMLIGFIILFVYSAILCFITPSTFLMMALLICLCLASASFWIIIYAMNFDIAEIYEFKYGKRREGLIISLSSFLTKAGVAIGMWLNGIVMSLLKVDPTVEVVTESMSSALRVIYAGIPIGIVFAMIVVCSRYKVNKNNITELQQALELKKAGEEYSIEAFKNIL